MRRFYCHCGQEVFFENTSCGYCGRELGFAPETSEILAGFVQDNGHFYNQKDIGSPQIYKVCNHRHSLLHCNWLVHQDDPNDQCISCRLTRIIPDQSKPHNPGRWMKLEAAKQRLIYTLKRLNLPLEPRSDQNPSGLAFVFLEDQRSNPDVDLPLVLSGHHQGLITLNAAEADETFRTTMREEMGETYRTLLGHFRHEIGHYYYQLMVESDLQSMEGFKTLFGDPKLDYQQALEAHYAAGPPPFWQDNHVSAYASAHPLEDWAETFAHYLHMYDTMETAATYGVTRTSYCDGQFDDWLMEWGRLAMILNNLNRSMGLRDAYPFVISPQVRVKFSFIDQLVHLFRQNASYELSGFRRI